MFCCNIVLSFHKHLPVYTKQFWPDYSAVPWRAQSASCSCSSLHGAMKKPDRGAGTETLQGFHFYPSFGDFCNWNTTLSSQQVAASIILHVWIRVCLYFFFFFLSFSLSQSTYWKRVSNESKNYHWSAKEYVPPYLSPGFPLAVLKSSKRSWDFCMGHAITILSSQASFIKMSWNRQQLWTTEEQQDSLLLSAVSLLRRAGQLQLQGSRRWLKVPNSAAVPWWY